MPEVIVCDNGFDSVEWRKFCHDLGAVPSQHAKVSNDADLTYAPTGELLMATIDITKVWPSFNHDVTKLYDLAEKHSLRCWWWFYGSIGSIV